MIKIVVASRRRAGMTREEHLKYFECVHGAKVLGAGREVLGNIARYSQNHVFDAVYGSGFTGQEFDSVGELWFVDGATLQSVMSNPYTVETIRPDEANFSDSASLLIAMVSEDSVAVRNPANADTKLMHFLYRHPAVDADTFVKRWRTSCTALASGGCLGDHLRGFVMNLPLPVSADAPPASCDGINSLWIDRSDPLTVLTVCEQYFTATGPENEVFIDKTRSFVLLAKEIQIHPVVL